MNRQTPCEAVATVMAMLRMTTCLTLSLTLGGVAAAGSDMPAPPVACTLAEIDGVAVTQADADAIRALLQPPPTAAATRRLAVDAALAWWDIHGWLAGSSNRGRLDAWRAWLSVGSTPEVQALNARQAAIEIARVGARAGMVQGACGDPLATSPFVGDEDVAVGDRGSRAAKVLSRSSASYESLAARLLRVAPPHLAPAPAAQVGNVDGVATRLRKQGLQPEVFDVVLALRQLETPLALALAALPSGATAGPVRTHSGLYWIERR